MNDIIKRYAVTILGNAPNTLVFANGLGTNQKIWASIFPHFEKDFRLVTFDYLGVGASDRTAYRQERYQDLHGFVMDIEEIFDALALQQATFIGHSVSGAIGILAALRRPRRFNSLVLIGASPHYINEPDGYFGGYSRQDIEDLLSLIERNLTGWASASLPALVESPEHPHLVQSLISSFQSQDSLVFSQFARAVYFSDLRAQIEKVTVPTLIIQSAHDSIVPLEVAHYMHRHIPHSILRQVSTRGHFPHLIQPREIATLIREFLSTLPPGDSSPSQSPHT